MSNILTRKNDGILVIEINRLNKKNAFTTGMYRALTHVLANAVEDAEVRAVVLHGSEDVFSAGNDLDDFIANPPDTSDAAAWVYLRTISAFPKPIIAGVCGPAVGIGTTMLLHCDLVYAGTNARFSLPFVNLGVCPEAASSLLLPKLIGHQSAAEILLTGDPFDAQTALQMKLVNRVFAPGEVLEFALSQAHNIAQKPLSAVLQIKRLLKLDDAKHIQDRLNNEAETFGQMVKGEAAREAIAAFLEKRKPDFSRL